MIRAEPVSFPMKKCLILAGVLAAFGGSLFAADASRPAFSNSNLNLRGVFESELPAIERKNRLKIILHPHFGDVLKYDHFRTAVGLRFSTSSRFELSAETNAFFAHGLGDAALFSEAGLADIRIAGKYRIGETLLRDWDTAVGFSHRFPLYGTPAQLTDGFRHVAPYVTFARPLAGRDDMAVFWGLGADWLTPTSVRGRHEKNDLTDDSTSLFGGVVVDRGAVHYTFETRYSTTRILGRRDDDVVMVRPGFVWEIPRRYLGGSQRQWVLGVAVPLSYGPDGIDVGIAAKLRLDFDFRRRKGRHPDATEARR